VRLWLRSVHWDRMRMITARTAMALLCAAALGAAFIMGQMSLVVKLSNAAHRKTMLVERQLSLDAHRAAARYAATIAGCANGHHLRIGNTCIDCLPLYVETTEN